MKSLLTGILIFSLGCFDFHDSREYDPQEVRDNDIEQLKKTKVENGCTQVQGWPRICEETTSYNIAFEYSIGKCDCIMAPHTNDVMSYTLDDGCDAACKNNIPEFRHKKKSILEEEIPVNLCGFKEEEIIQLNKFCHPDGECYFYYDNEITAVSLEDCLKNLNKLIMEGKNNGNKKTK